MYVVILANTNAEAMQHAKKHKLPRGRFRYATKASTIRGLRIGEIHELASFRRRFDKHAILAAMRYTKGVWVKFDEADEADGRLPLEDALEAAYAENELIEIIETATPDDFVDAPRPELDSNVLESAAEDVPVKRTRKPPKPKAAVVIEEKPRPVVADGFWS